MTALAVYVPALSFCSSALTLYDSAPAMYVSALAVYAPALAIYSSALTLYDSAPAMYVSALAVYSPALAIYSSALTLYDSAPAMYVPALAMYAAALAVYVPALAIYAAASYCQGTTRDSEEKVCDRENKINDGYKIKKSPDRWTVRVDFRWLSSLCVGLCESKPQNKKAPTLLKGLLFLKLASTYSPGL